MKHPVDGAKGMKIRKIITSGTSAIESIQRRSQAVIWALLKFSHFGDCDTTRIPAVVTSLSS